MERINFKGELPECLKFLAENYQNIQPDVRGVLSQFTGVSTEAIGSWLTKGRLPTGENFIKLLYFLERVGFSVSNVAKLNENVQKAGRIIAFGVIDLNSLSSYLGIVDRDSMLKVLTGRRGLSREKLETLESFVKEYEELLQEKIAEWPFLHLQERGNGIPKSDAVPKISEKDKRVFLEKVGSGKMLSGGSSEVMALIRKQQEELSMAHAFIEKNLLAQAENLIELLEAYPRSKKNELLGNPTILALLKLLQGKESV